MAEKHDVESQGAKSRDHDHPRHHFWKHAHRDWRVWCAVILMLVLIMVYVLTVDFSVQPEKHATQQTPAANVP